MKRIVLNTSSSGLQYLNINHQTGNIPLNIAFGSMVYNDDNKSINPRLLSKMMVENPKEVASTTPADDDRINEIFADLYRRNYDEIFVCCLSSKFSKSYEILMRQQKKYAGRMNIYIYDTKSLNLPEAALAYEADFLLRAGAPFSEIIATLDDIRRRSVFEFTLESLNYIVRNKKLSAPAGFVATLFDVKPIMQINQDGLIVPADKIRKFERAVREIANRVASQVDPNNNYIYLSDGGVDEITDYCAMLVKDELGLDYLPIIPVSCVSLANHGPKGIALGAFSGKLPRIVRELPPYKMQGWQ